MFLHIRSNASVLFPSERFSKEGPSPLITAQGHTQVTSFGYRHYAPYQLPLSGRPDPTLNITLTISTISQTLATFHSTALEGE